MSDDPNSLAMSPNWREEFDEFPLHRTLGISIDEVRPGFARIAMKTSKLTLGGVGASVHGGVLALLVDIAMLEALIPMFERDEQPAGTADLSLTYLRPATGNRIFAEATVLRKGRQLAVTEVAILDDEGRLCAKGRTIYSIRPKTAGRDS